MEELVYKIGITLIPGVGDKTAKNLIAHCGSPEAVFKETRKSLERIPGIGPKSSENISRQAILSRAEEELNFIRQNNLSSLYFTDKDYPSRLKQCEDGPVMLYCKGSVDLNPSKSLSIVGSRNATAYGRDLCGKLINELRSLAPLIISGLAYGIDISAHQAALETGLPTLGVLAHGLDRVYPSLHTSTAQKMVRNKGGLVTDFSSGIKPERENFPKRNRIIAGMCDAVIVIETTHKGGALITAEIANSYNRDVFAVPGRVSDSLSEGCNQLIKTHKANLLTGVDDLKYILGWDNTDVNQREMPSESVINLTDDEEKIYGFIKKSGKIEVDHLCMKIDFPISKILQILMNLELKGIIKSLPGKLYTLS